MTELHRIQRSARATQRPQDPRRLNSHSLHLRLMKSILSLIVARPSSLPCVCPRPGALPYNHPGLVVDLGVGLWAWPVPCDADGDGDFDLIVSCPDKPSNGVWFFENATGDTAKNKLPVFKPGRRLSKTVHYVMPSYVDGGMRVLTPGLEYPELHQDRPGRESEAAGRGEVLQAAGHAAEGPKVRHNQWRYVDYDGDGALDLSSASKTGATTAGTTPGTRTASGQNGPLHGFVYVLRNTGTTAEAELRRAGQVVEADGKPVDTFGCPSPNFADFDGDGDLDLLCGEFLDGFTYFENIGTRKEPKYAAGRRLKDADGAAAGDGPGDDRAGRLRLGQRRRPRPDRRRRGRPRRPRREHRQARRATARRSSRRRATSSRKPTR